MFVPSYHSYRHAAATNIISVNHRVHGLEHPPWQPFRVCMIDIPGSIKAGPRCRLETIETNYQKSKSSTQQAAMPSAPLRRHATPSTTSQTFAPALGDPREHLARAQRFLRANDHSGARHAYRQALESASNRDLAACFLSHVRLAQLSGDSPRAVQEHLESAWGLRGYLSEHLRPRDAVGSYFRAVGLQLAGMYAQEAGSKRRESEVLRALESMGLEERGGREDAQLVMRTARAAATAAASPTATTAAVGATVLPAAAPTTTATAVAAVVAAPTPAATPPPPPPPPPPLPAAAGAADSLMTAPAEQAPAAVATGERVREGGGRGRGGRARGRGDIARRGRSQGGGVVQTCQPGRGRGRQGRELSRRGDAAVNRHDGGCRGEALKGRTAVSCGECGRAMESACVGEGEGGEVFCDDCAGAFDKALAEGPREDGTPCSGCTDKTQPVTVEPDGKWYCAACVEEFYEEMEAERAQQELGGGGGGGGGGGQAGKEGAAGQTGRGEKSDKGRRQQEGAESASSKADATVSR